MIALDGGTSRTRARLLDARGAVLASASRAVGVRNTAISREPAGRTSELVQAVREAIAEVYRTAHDASAIGSPIPDPDAVVAAGMLSSDVGLHAVPHAVAPAGIDDLARGVRVVSLAEVIERPIHFIPGIRTPPGGGSDGWTEADLMRGEESETFGAIRSLEASGRIALDGDSLPPAFIWPGSHTKLIELDRDRRIIRSTTSLAGELTQAIWNHTLIAASLPESWPSEIDEDAVDAGRRAVEQNGLGRAAFLVRIASVTGQLDPTARAWFWIGAVLADDATFLARHPILGDEPTRPVWVGGRDPLRGILARFLQGLRRGEVHSLDDETADLASPRGACLIAGRSSMLGAEGPGPTAC